MDESRLILVAVAASLARLQVRLLKLAAKPDPHLIRAADVDPPSPWLDATPPNTSISGVIHAVALAQAHLLRMAESSAPIDGKRACIVLQHVACSGTTWGTMVLRMAGRLGVTLGQVPRDDMHGVSLHGHPLPPLE